MATTDVVKCFELPGNSTQEVKLPAQLLK